MILYRTAKWAEERKLLASMALTNEEDQEKAQSQLEQVDLEMMKEAEAWKIGTSSPFM